MMPSPLFPNFTQAMADEAAASPERRRRLARQIRQAVNQAVSGGQSAQPRQWARQGLKSLFDVMGAAGEGPIGQIVQALLRPNGQPLANPQRELPAAMNLMVDLLDRTAEIVHTPNTPQQRAAEREARHRANHPAPQEFDYRRNQPRGRNVFGGPSGGYAADDPVMTGEMIQVESSNVWGIAFRWNEANPSAGTLLVRFWEKEKGKKTAAGSTYAYYNVHPQVFKAFQLAASKGRFVWDRLRVRGTVTGHQYAYRLVGLSARGYVPRQAQRYGNNEYFIRRQVAGADGRQFRSSLPDTRIGPLRGRVQGRASAYGPGGTVNGQPNRGAPNRGR